MELTRKKQCEKQPSWNSVPKNAHILIPTLDKDDDPVGVDYSHFIYLSVVPTRASPLPVLGFVKSTSFIEKLYLAQDFFYQFMATQQNIVKTLLHLIGISSLFIAAMLEALNWNLNPVTVVSWLNIYMQVAYLNERYEVLLPQYPQQIFVQIAELLDLCVLDIGCLEYTYGVLAASALYLFSSSELMKKVSGYEWCEIEECVKWMVLFAMAIREVGSSKLKHFRGIAPEDLHTIQMHVNSLDLLDKAQAKQALLAEQNKNSPFPNYVLTPPLSSKTVLWTETNMTLETFDSVAEVPVLLVLTPVPLQKCCQ